MKKKKKKTGLIVVIAIIVIIAFAGSRGSEDGKKAIVSDGATNTDAKGGSTSGKNEKKGKAAIDEQVLFELDGIKVTATEYVTDSFTGEGIKLLLENNGTKDIGLGCDALIVNDYMVDNLFSTSVAAGKKEYKTVDLLSSELSAAGIENVGKVELKFHTFDADSFETLNDTELVEIKTSLFAAMDSTPNDAGSELYNENGIRIVGKYVDENSFWGAAVLFYIENNTEKNVIIQCNDMSINGFMVTPYFSSTVYAGKKAVDDITLMSAELEENNITSIDDIELKFNIIDENYNSLYETDIIKFSTK